MEHLFRQAAEASAAFGILASASGFVQGDAPHEASIPDAGFVQGDAPHDASIPDAGATSQQPCTPPGGVLMRGADLTQELAKHFAHLADNNPKFVAALLANQNFAGVPGDDVAQLLQASSPPPPPAAKQPCKPPPSKAMTSAQPMARGLAWVVPPPPAPKQEAVVGAAHAAISKQQQFGKHPGIVPPPAPPPRSEVPAPPSFSSASEPQPLKKARGPMGWPESASMGRAPLCEGATLG